MAKNPRNFQKLKAVPEGESIASTEKMMELLNETSQKSSKEYLDMNDFPELKLSGKQNRKYFHASKTNGSRFKTNKLSVVSSGSEIQLSSDFPALPTAGNLKTKEVSSVLRKDVSFQAVLDSDIAVSTDNTMGAEKSDTSHKENKGTIKKISGQPQRNPNKKKRSDPVFINFQDILTANKHKKKIKEQKIVRKKAQRHKDKELLSGNLLDSSNPKRNRGKHREIKKKRLSNLKMTIIKERIIKNKLREKTVATIFSSSPILDSVVDNIDFKAEIKMYLNDLNNIKLRNLEREKKVDENVNAEKINVQMTVSPTMNLAEKGEEKPENVDSNFKEKIIPQITANGEIKFSSKFREYCDNIITPDLNSAVKKLIEELIKLQDRLFSRDPIKAKAKKRHVSGIREVRKYLSLKKVKMIIIAPNLEKLQMEGSVYDLISEFKSMATSQNVPYGFALDRFKLGKSTRKNVPVSAFAILSYEGLEALYEDALHQLLEAKKKFSDLVKPKVTENAEYVSSKVLSTLASSFDKVLHVSKEDPSDVDVVID